MNQEVSLRSVTTETRFRSQGTPNEIRGEESGIALVRVCLRVLGFSSVRMIPSMPHTRQTSALCNLSNQKCY